MTLTKGYNMRARERENIGMASDKDLTLAPLCCGLNVACLLRAGFGDRGLSGPSPLKEQLWDCHGIELMH